ncbi:MAG: hypothetical protein ACK47B_01050 [Armatimonadota bacterium]
MSDLERDPRARPVPGWVWLVVAVLIAAIAWWLVAPDGDMSAGINVPERVAGERQTAPAIGGEYYDDPATRETLPVAELRASPDRFEGQPVEGTAIVAEVADGGFWATAEGERIFVQLDPAILVSPPELQSGQHVRLSGTVRAPSAADGMEGLSADLRERVASEPAVLHANDLTILDTAEAGGTRAAE